MKIFHILIQARLDSRRLPGKVLKKMDKTTVIKCLIDRLKALKAQTCAACNGIVVRSVTTKTAMIKLVFFMWTPFCSSTFFYLVQAIIVNIGSRMVEIA